MESALYAWGLRLEVNVAYVRRPAAGQCGKAVPSGTGLLSLWAQPREIRPVSDGTESHRLSALCGGKPQADRMITAKLSKALRLYAAGPPVILSFMKFAYLTLRRAARVASVVILIFAGTIFAQQPHTLTGDIRFHKSFHSKILNNDRDVVIYLPPGYESNKNKRYPILYLHDGQNLFDGATSFIPGREWRVDETAQTLITAGRIEPLIVVGIYNAGKARIDEYTPAADEKYKMGGKADLYGRMLVEELKPFIDATYRTRKDAGHTGLGGSSLGGIVSMYLALKYPDVFGRVAVVSPSVWFANKQIVHYAEGLKRKPKIRIWLDMGTKEGSTAKDAQAAVVDARLLEETLRKKGWKTGKDLSYFEAEGAEHNETAWAARVGPLLEFLFPPKM